MGHNSDDFNADSHVFLVREYFLSVGEVVGVLFLLLFPITATLIIRLSIVIFPPRSTRQKNPIAEHLMKHA